jgi:hypothetical protein
MHTCVRCVARRCYCSCAEQLHAWCLGICCKRGLLLLLLLLLHDAFYAVSQLLQAASPAAIMQLVVEVLVA